jgi:tetratricopeptide (TPR) repeat protein
MGVRRVLWTVWVGAVVAHAAPSDVAGVLTRGAQAEKKGEYRQAVLVYLSALRESPGHTRLRRALDRSARKLKKQTDATRAADTARVVRDARMSVDRRYSIQADMRARVDHIAKQISQDKLLEAADALNRVREEAPGLDEAEVQRDRLDRKFTARAKRRFPTVQHQAVYEGMAFYNRGQWEEAARSLRLAQSAGPWPTELAVARAEDALALADKKVAADIWRKERAELISAARQAENDGDLKAARKRLEKILARDPADPEALDALKNLGKVTVVVEKAVREEARQKEVPKLLSRGVLQTVGERYTEALDTFGQVLEIDPSNTEATEQINEIKRILENRKLYVPPVVIKSSAEDKYREGLQLYGAEKYAAAQLAFEEALRLDPKHSEARLALRRIKENKD